MMEKGAKTHEQAAELAAASGLEKMTLIEESTGKMIFGYGSLLWKQNFKFTSSHWGYVENWSRRFWQGSPDHRGTPEKPGRVAGILPAKDVIEIEKAAG
jgi:glutathione-specific gamma-glutamylcyclotransferase